MKYTLLKIVQKTLDSMDSDAVSSIDDTEEAAQVASIAEDVYYQVISKQDWAFLERLIQVDGAADSLQPTKMVLTDPVKDVVTVWYDCKKITDAASNYRELTYYSPRDFLSLCYSRKSNDTNMQTVTTDDGVVIFVLNNKAPEFWTSFDDTNIMFDSYDAAVDSVIQESKTSVIGYLIPDFVKEDDFIPDLPDNLFPMYLAEVKSASFRYLKQQTSVRDEKVAFHDRSKYRNTARADGAEARKGFGRKSNNPIWR